MKKRILSLLLVLTILLGLAAGCGSDQEPDTPPTEATEAPEGTQNKCTAHLKRRQTRKRTYTQTLSRLARAAQAFRNMLAVQEQAEQEARLYAYVTTSAVQRNTIIT